MVSLLIQKPSLKCIITTLGKETLVCHYVAHDGIYALISVSVTSKSESQQPDGVTFLCNRRVQQLECLSHVRRESHARFLGALAAMGTKDFQGVWHLLGTPGWVRCHLSFPPKLCLCTWSHPLSAHTHSTGFLGDCLISPSKCHSQEPFVLQEI